jgi:CheY-like chemotaxis protein
MTSQDLSPAERLKQVSELLKMADRYVLAGEFEMATRQVEEVFKIDPRNIYAQAYLKRIEVFRHRGGSQPAGEETPHIGSDELEHTEGENMESQNTRTILPLSERSSPLIRVSKPKYKVTLEELRRIVEEIISSEAETLTSSQSGDIHTPEGVPSPPVYDEEQKKRKQNERKYRQALEYLWKSGSASDEENEKLEELRISLGISEESHDEIERSVKLSAYVNAVKESWQNGLITPTGAAALDELRDRFDISVNEHLMIESRILFELHGVKVKGVIMIVDDDVELAKIIKAILRDEGYSPFSATSPEQALATLERTTPDLILLDITFPKPSISGFTMYEKIREIPRLQFVPVIFMSGLDEEHIIQVGKKLGADDYITKPCSDHMLISSIEGKIKRYNEMKKMLNIAGEESP